MTLFQAEAEGIFSVCKLVDKIARVAPDGEVRVGGRGVEGGACAVLIVVVEQMGRIVVSRPGR